MYKLGIIGCGVMGKAIYTANASLSTIVYDVLPEKTSAFTKLGATSAKSIQEVIDNAEYLLISIKPQQAPDLFKSADFSRAKVIISIMAGLKIEKIIDMIGSDDLGIVRVMPNLPIMVKKGTSALAFSNVSDIDKQFVLNMFENGGVALVVEEKYFDAVTAVSGSGPAYVYMFIEGMTQGGVVNGLSYEDAKSLAIGTIIGAATYASQSDMPLSQMVDAVCSKGGTTIEAVNYFREKDLIGTVIEAETKAAIRSGELSK